MNYQELIEMVSGNLSVTQKQVISTMKSSIAFKGFKNLEVLSFEFRETDLEQYRAATNIGGDPDRYFDIFRGIVPEKTVEVTVLSGKCKSRKIMYVWSYRRNGELRKKVSSVSIPQ
jgi:hypothetical protein